MGETDETPGFLARLVRDYQEFRAAVQDRPRVDNELLARTRVAPPTRPSTPEAARIADLQAQADDLLVDDVGDFARLAAKLTELADLVRQVGLPAVARAQEPLWARPYRTSGLGALGNFFADERVKNVHQMARQCRSTGDAVKTSLERVSASLADTARVVESVGRMFARQVEMNDERMRSMNQRFQAELQALERRPTTGRST